MSLLKSIMQFTFSHPARRAPPVPLPAQPLRQPAVLTSTQSRCESLTDESLPVVVMDLLVNRQFSAVRAWRTYRGLTMTSLLERAKMRSPTLLALDRGEVDLCEWTVDILAQALRVEPGLLLKAERLAVKTREGTAWPLVTSEGRSP